eukprot:GILJ01002205.1.p1 GENE.GILJ01002205.1~~GILJ01002205.1.p1  ORF type:complete len:631 (+),score=88.56 GILJ01002205.1:1223-3115(+)
MLFGLRLFVSCPSKKTLEKELIDESPGEPDKAKMTVDLIGRMQATWPFQWKRANFFLWSFVVPLGILVILEFSYSPTYKQNAFTVMICTFIARQWVDKALDSTMKETLLMTPLITTLAVINTLAAMGAANFLNFLNSYFINLTVALIKRNYLEKIAGSIRGFVKEIKARRKAKSGRQNRKKKRAEEEEEDEDDLDEKRREGLEPVLATFAQYAGDSQSIFMVPFIMGFLYIFAAETQILSNYNILLRNLTYYLMFAVIIILPSLVNDLSYMYTLEMLQGFKLYDYITYCRYRFEQRTTVWKGDEKFVDDSIDDKLQTLDKMAFSSQLFFMVTLHSWGMNLVFMSITIIIRAGFNPFADPALVPLIGIMFLFSRIAKWSILHVAEKTGLWKHRYNNLIEQAKTKSSYATLKQVIDFEDEMQFTSRVMTNTYRSRFMEKNRKWLMDNLEKVLSPRSLLEVRPQLMKVYARLMNMNNKIQTLEGRRSSTVKRGSLGDDTASPEWMKKHAITPLATDENISDDDEDDMYLQKDWNYNGSEKSQFLARMWLHKARAKKGTASGFAYNVKSHFIARSWLQQARARVRTRQKTPDFTGSPKSVMIARVWLQQARARRAASNHALASFKQRVAAKSTQ